MNLLSVEGLTVSFFTQAGPAVAVNDVSFSIKRGEALGLVGESGSGKSVTALSVMGLIAKPGKVTSGKIFYDGRNLRELSQESLRRIRGAEIAMIFQDPMTSLNPVYTVGEQIAEAVRLHLGLSRKQAREKAVESLAAVSIPDPARRANDYPHQMSGGMRQRVMIAMALSCDPKLLIADEPTTALDVTIQAQILELLRKLREERNLGLLLITHDLGVVAETVDRAAVMYAGKIVENAPITRLFASPQHPYTTGLIESVPRIGQNKGRLSTIEGVVPRLTDLPPGCAFAPRCAEAESECRAGNMPMVMLDSDTQHQARCRRRPRQA